MYSSYPVEAVRRHISLSAISAEMVAEPDDWTLHRYHRPLRTVTHILLSSNCRYRLGGSNYSSVQPAS
jgi:hypothetical protein